LKKWSGWANMGDKGGHNRHTAAEEDAEDSVGAGDSAAGQSDTTAGTDVKIVSDSVDTANGTADTNAGHGTQPSDTALDAQAAAQPHTATVIRPAGITPDAMRALGWRVKRILDEGRVQYIRSQYCMSARQVRYCARELSPECAMIVATQEQQ
jgi:hypothetical protein